MRIGMLGPLEVRDDSGAAAAVPGIRLRTLLIILALRPGRVVPAGVLIDGIWLGNPPAQAQNALQALVSRLRRTVPALVIESQPNGYRLVIDEDSVDVSRFERLVAQARSASTADTARILREALGLWRGPALQELPDSLAASAAGLHELRLTAIEERADADIRLGRADELITELMSLVAEHPLRERMVAALIRALTAAGRSAEALTTYERAREALADALGADPSPELSALHTAILRGELNATAGRTNLRAGLTSFIGRDNDLAQVTKLADEYRLITLTGPGGSGKTRLAVEAARLMLSRQPDGVWLVELAPVTADIPRAVLAALGVHESGTTPTDQLVAALRTRQALLVLDNCEHVLDTVAALADRLLGACPQLRILVTSREPLGIIGEALWPVEPLALAPQDAGIAEVMSAPAVRLFADRANAARPGFSLDMAAVVQICRALDGMPLAIELAAARMRSMTAAQLAGRLDDRFRVLTGGNRTALPRHQTLRAVIDWSWDLLTDEERVVLRRLAVFARGAAVEAAGRVCGENAQQVLDALVDKSLLVTTGEGTLRYGMLETIKEYSLLKLTEAGELEQTRQAHATYFAEFVEIADQHLRGAGQLLWLDALTADHDNIDAAVRSAVQTNDAATAERLVAGAGWYWLLRWWLRGHKATGAEMAAVVLALPGSADEAIRAKACIVSALFNLSGNGDEMLAREWLTTAHQLAAQHKQRDPLLRLVDLLHPMLGGQGPLVVAYPFDDEDIWVRAMAYMSHATMLLSLGRSHAEAEADFVTALSAFRTAGDRWGITHTLISLSDLAAWRGDFPGAISHREESMAIIAQFTSSTDVWKPRLRLVQLHWLLGDHERVAAIVAAAEHEAAKIGLPDALAAIAYTKAELARWSGDRTGARGQLARLGVLTEDISLNWQFRAMVRDSLGYLDIGDGDLDSARRHRIEALSWALRSMNAFCVGQILLGIAEQALHQNQPDEAARLLAAADAIRGTADKSLPDLARIEAATRAALTDEQFTGAASHGRTATIETIEEFTSVVLRS